MENAELNQPQDLAAEEAAMQQRLAEIEAAGEKPSQSLREAGQLGATYKPSPLEEPIPPKESSPEETGEAGEAVAPKFFVGEMTEEDVLSRLKLLDGLESRLTNKVLGHLGPFGRELKALREAQAAQATEIHFDSSALAPLKNLDEGLYDVLKEGLEKGFKANSAVASVKPLVEDLMREQSTALAAVLHDNVETRLIQVLLPNYLDISEQPGFSDWIVKNQSEEVVRAFRSWDDESAIGKKDAMALIRGYREFVEAKQKEESAVRAKQEALKKSAVPVRRTNVSASTSAPQILDEDKAFQARLKEIEERGLRL